MVEHNSTSKCIGSIFAILAGVSFILINTFFKMVNNLSLPEVVLGRSIVLFVLNIPFVVVLQHDVRGTQGNRLLLWVGSVVSTITTALDFISISILPFGDAIAILYCNPVLVMLLSHCFLKELCGIYKTLTVILLLIGIFLVTKPPGLIKILIYLNVLTDNELLDNGNQSSLKIYGYIAAFSATTCLAFATLLKKKLSDTTHFSVIIFSSAIGEILASALAIPLVSSYTIPDNWTDIIYTLLVGGFSMAYFMFIMLSLQRLSASLVSMLRSLEIVMAYIVGIIWFQESLDTISLVGATTIMLSVTFLTQEENMKRLISKDSTEVEKSESLPLINGQDD